MRRVLKRQLFNWGSQWVWGAHAPIGLREWSGHIRPVCGKPSNSLGEYKQIGFSKAERRGHGMEVTRQEPAHETLAQQHQRTLNDLSRRGAMWIDVEQYADDDWRLAEYAVVNYERDTNATITDRVGDAEEEDEKAICYLTEEKAMEAAIRVNRARLECEKNNPGYYAYIPGGMDEP